MNSVYKLIILFPLLILGCSSKQIDKNNINQEIDTLNLNIYSNEGNKIYTVKSPSSNYDVISNILNLKETTIHLYENSNLKYIITSNKSELSNNHNKLSLSGNVKLINKDQENEILTAEKFIWNINNSNYILKGNVKIENTNIVLTSNKATLNQDNIIEFYNPVNYINKESNNKGKYEIISENALYNIITKSVIFNSKDKRVRSTIYF